MLDAIYLSAIGFEPGVAADITGLGEAATAELTMPEHGLAKYRVSNHESWELARITCERTLAKSPSPPDLLVYVSESDPQVADSLARLVRVLGLPGLRYISVAGHGCGNLGPAIQVASDALNSRRHDRVLLVVADRVLHGSRVMPTGLSIFSDGAASCLVTHDQDAAAARPAKVVALTTRNYVQPDSAPAAGSSMLSMAATAVAATTDILRDTGLRLADVDHVLFANYRIVSQKFLASAMGFPEERLIIGPIGEFGHCFSADILATLDLYIASRRVGPGDLVLASATGPDSWSVMAIEIG